MTPVTPLARRFAIGDPQASAATFFDILDRHRLLGADGKLADDVALTSMGDHFDYGRAEERDEAAQSGIEILAWLASHPSEQVTILLGNHDLGRVGELATFDDATFAEARVEAAAIYENADVGREVSEAHEQALLRKYPMLPSAELAARDFSAFSVEQRDLVWRLLSSNRFQVATAFDNNILATHAGVTVDELEATGLEKSLWSSAPAIADHLNQCLGRAVLGRTTDAPLSIDGLHRPGSRDGEGVGMFYHRPASARSARPFSRRYDPQRLVPGIVQIVGHISDDKCRSLLGEWAVGEPAQPGELRYLRLEESGPRYRAGLPATLSAGETSMIFTDGGMSRIDATHYRMLDVAALVSKRG